MSRDFNIYVYTFLYVCIYVRVHVYVCIYREKDIYVLPSILAKFLQTII